MTLANTDPMAGEASAKPPGPAHEKSFASRLFGYDIFISFALGPPPRGSQAYASDLARRLRERDLSVFYSEDEAAPGAKLDMTLRRALHRSKILVVLCNAGMLAEPRWVREEVEEFRARHPDRPIIPINIGGALLDPALGDDAQEWLRFRDRIWLDETVEAWTTGITSPEVLRRLLMAPRQSRANQLMRGLMVGTASALALLALGAGIAAWIATEQRSLALAERETAEEQRGIAVREREIAEEQRGIAVRQREIAEEQRNAATRSLRRATAANLAFEATDRAEVAPNLSLLLSLEGANLAEAETDLTDEFLPSFDTLIRGGLTRRGALVSMISGHPATQRNGDPNTLTMAKARPDGKIVASSSPEQPLRFWRRDSGKVETANCRASAQANQIEWSPDGRRLLVGHS